MGDTDGNSPLEDETRRVRDSLDEITPRKRGRPKGSLGVKKDQNPVPPRIQKLRESRPEKRTDGRTRQTTITLFDGDFEIIAFIKDTLGTNSISETVRTSLRAYAMHLERLLNR